MNWFFSCSNSKDDETDLRVNLLAAHEKGETCDDVTKSMIGKRFTHSELASATRNFKNLIGEGNFGCVYKGVLKSGEMVAVKQLKEKYNLKFNVDAHALMFSHSNLVTLIDYCTDGDQKFLVSEYMPLGSLQNHLFDLKPKQKPIDWSTRLKIAVGVARGLEYLHCKTNPPVIYRYMRSSNILLDNDFNPKLSDFGVVEDESNARHYVPVLGYCTPEYLGAFKWTLKSDIYTFGVVLLELITGRKAFDDTKKQEERCLVDWFRPLIKDRNKFIQVLDPLLQGRVPVRVVIRMIAVTAMCLKKYPDGRPLINDIVVRLQHIASIPQIPDD
ncbi:hypothetical protein LXL04_029075 [Taraxacum kok-saghyz]